MSGVSPPLGRFSLNSLTWRLLLASSIWAAIVLTLTTIVLVNLYRQDAESGFNIRLEDALNGLLEASISPGVSTPVVPREYGDKLYNSPLTGYYWQVMPADGKDGRPQTSQSLVGELLAFPFEQAKSRSERKGILVVEIVDDNGDHLRMLQQEYTFPSGQGGRRYSFIVTANLNELDGAVARYRRQIVLALGLLGLGLVAATLFLVRWGLSPLRSIEAGLLAIRSGAKVQLEGDLPIEIAPLQREINALIKSNHDIVERARTHVGNLAHALKTPLSVLTNEAKAASGPLAAKVAEQVEIMRDQVSHHLDRARMVARVGVIGDLTEVKPVVEGLARTLEKIYGRDRDMSVTAECLEGVKFQGERQDLEEMLGNLMDNACKWAKSEVTATVALVPKADKLARAWLAIMVDDDGPGLTPDERQAARQRGKRLDETKPGSGLGLSIVTDLVGLYGGKFDLEESPAGGLRATVTLPAG
ncbi:MAG: sensor histidine kinase [Hyphomicrobiaceae bacterium]